jgi:transposase
VAESLHVDDGLWAVLEPLLPARVSLRIGRPRVVVERTFAWLHNFRRLGIRWERDADLHYALLRLGCSLICWRQIRP